MPDLPAMPTDPQPVLLYDDTTALGRARARVLWHVVSRDRFELRPWRRVALERWGLAPEDCRGHLVWVGGDGTVTRGRGVWPELLRHGHRFLRPGVRPVEGLVRARARR
ncbi:hypothetical protein ACF3NS_12710 [Arsenicicoccus cauae]|uniref:Uncharacterized protein n=1 Tax=Arsenicicoccus cauae TaxID=2663847 RepID=A0A6I3IA10_9MICO|nr:hypothetical protein [Arsenicicoccus cauae]MTB70507.1 hypothetical protein [Arsenicicoccus cauae]